MTRPAPPFAAFGHAMRAAAIATALLLGLALPAVAQGVNVGFGGLRQDTSLPVEVSADALRIDQSDGRAVFSGNVVAAQGDLRLTAGEVRVEYAEGGSGIGELIATGGVRVSTPADSAEAAEARYDVTTGILTLSGAVKLTQGQATIAGERLVANLRDGTGTIEGRVQTIFLPGKASE
jgi:lipopolysaccharide export system protein LptA